MQEESTVILRTLELM